MLIEELTIRGLLSFGPDTPAFALAPLNVLIGPNGSGKSNVIEAIGLLRSAAKELTRPIRESPGGIGDWIWKGDPSGGASIDAVITGLHGRKPLRHVLAFRNTGHRFELTDERIENAKPYDGFDKSYFFYRYQDGRPVIMVSDGNHRSLQRQDVATDESILTQRKDPDQYPVLAELAAAYAGVRLYRDWQFGRTSIFRRPQQADMPGDHLEEDFSNLGLYLNHVRSEPKAKRAVLERVRALYEGLDDFDVRVRGGTVELFLTEGDFTIPAGRLSDGTLRYICLVAILCDPAPPPLICIEEPELGLHPDILPRLADLMGEASARTQIVVTTHSDVLVDALTEHPEYVVVVEKHDGQTTLNRLDAGELSHWLCEYRLGQLWTRGEIGGTRW
jgi:predicted ATPase